MIPNLNCRRRAGRRGRSDHGVRLQADERIAVHGYRVRPRQDGHRPGLGLGRTADADRGPAEDVGPAAGQSADGSRPGDGLRSGGRYGGHAGGRGSVAGAKDPTRRDRGPRHQEDLAVSRGRAGRPAGGHGRGAQNIRTALGRTRQPGGAETAPQTQNVQLIRTTDGNKSRVKFTVS